MALHSFKLDLNAVFRLLEISKAIVQIGLWNRLKNHNWHGLITLQILILNRKANLCILSRKWISALSWLLPQLVDWCWTVSSPPISCVGVFVGISSERPGGDGWGATEWSLERQKPRPRPWSQSSAVKPKSKPTFPKKTKDLDWLTLRVWEMFLDRVPQQKGRLILELRK